MIGVLVMEKKIGCPIPNCLRSRREVCILLSRTRLGCDVPSKIVGAVFAARVSSHFPVREGGARHRTMIIC